MRPHAQTPEREAPRMSGQGAVDRFIDVVPKALDSCTRATNGMTEKLQR